MKDPLRLITDDVVGFPDTAQEPLQTCWNLVPPSKTTLRGTVAHNMVEFRAALNDDRAFIVLFSFKPSVTEAAALAPVTDIATKPWFSYSDNPFEAMSQGAARLLVSDTTNPMVLNDALDRLWRGPEFREYRKAALALR
jgi:hypothetical protein